MSRSNEPPGTELNAEAGKLFKAGDYRGAANYYERAIAASDGVSTYFSNLAAAYLKLRKYPAAQEAARRALILEPRSFKARYRRAMARKGMNLIPEALVDIAGVLTADPANSEARIEFAALVQIQNKTGRRPLEPEDVLRLDFPHAYGSSANPPRSTLTTDLHRMSLPFFYKVDIGEKPGSAAVEPGVKISGCMTCGLTVNKKKLKTCQKCRRANYCSVECQRADWPIHKPSCKIPIDKGTTIRAGRSIHHHQFFNVHLLFYALRALGPPILPGGRHDFLLMVIIDLVPLTPDSPRKRIAVRNILPVPVSIIPEEILEIHRGVLRATLPDTPLHCLWITTTGVYPRGEDEESRVGPIPVMPFILSNVGNPAFSLDVYSHSWGAYRRITPDLDFLFESINDELRLDVQNHYSMQA
ncbi:hypothetical protein C8R43DRAFT_982900 [Mycena crocata]|nr:hypothetical protein C8R43DRAFT_982900 [Mycena crocata]